MRLIVDVPSMATNQSELIIEHNGAELRWNVVNFDKRVFTSLDNDVCKHINQYWSALPAYKQEKIFEIYNSIRNALENIFDTITLTTTLLPLVKALYEEHKLEDLEHWIHWKSDIIIPDRFEESYIVDDLKPGNRAKTYTRPDYSGLVALALSLRLMIPIWGEFIYRTKGDTGTNFKEFLSFQLLETTELMTSAPMEKLKLYVENNIQTDKSISSAILNCIGSVDYAQWLLSLVTVRRLCIGDITGSNPITNLVTFIFNFISQKVAGNNNSSFGQMIKDKIFESPSSSGDHNASRTEGYKIKQETPTGDIAILEHYLNDPIQVAIKLDPNVDIELLKSCLSTSKALENELLWKSQVLLTQWILQKVVSPRGIIHLTKQKTINAIAIAQTWLWQRGHKELSCLISAIASDNSSEMQLSGIDSRARISRDQMEILQKVYPFATIKSQKQKTKPVNDAVAAIDSLASMFSQRDWILTAPIDHVKIITGNENYTRYSAPHDIKILIAKVVIDLKSDIINKLNNTI
jgi:hypothetical protein